MLPVRGLLLFYSLWPQPGRLMSNLHITPASSAPRWLQSPISQTFPIPLPLSLWGCPAFVCGQVWSPGPKRWYRSRPFSDTKSSSKCYITLIKVSSCPYSPTEWPTHGRSSKARPSGNRIVVLLVTQSSATTITCALRWEKQEGGRKKEEIYKWAKWPCGKLLK